MLNSISVVTQVPRHNISGNITVGVSMTYVKIENSKVDPEILFKCRFYDDTTYFFHITW